LAASANFQSLSFLGKIDSSTRTSTIFIAGSPGHYSDGLAPAFPSFSRRRRVPLRLA
jgi:hypothetical protein